MKQIKLFIALAAFLAFGSSVFAQSDFYRIGSVTVTDYYVDPINGNDINSGLTRALAKKTVSSIWNTIPSTQTLTKGFRLNLLPGRYSSASLPASWENRRGTATAPIIIQPANLSGGVIFQRDILMAGVSYFYLLGVTVTNPTTTGSGRNFYCNQCDHILLRGNTFNGALAGLSNPNSIAAQTVYVNNSKNIFLENNDIQGAKDNAIEFVAVQSGHIKANKIHNSIGWCASVRAGSAYVYVDANRVQNCGAGGVTVGQISSLEEMVTPFTRFEANYVKVTNNIIQNITGSAIAVNGGFNILVASNTASTVGGLGGLVEFGFGSRVCAASAATCIARRDAGGWGPTVVGALEAQPIGNKNVYFANNVIFNPEGTVSAKHFDIPVTRFASVVGMPLTQQADDGLKIFSNIIWNGTSSVPLGIEGDIAGCQTTNPTCNATQLVAENKINTLLPTFRDVATGDLRPASSSTLESEPRAEIPDFSAIDSSLNPIVEGEKTNNVTLDFSGNARTLFIPGAFAGSLSSIDFQNAALSETSGGGGGFGGGRTNAPSDSPPSLSRFLGSAKKSRGRVVLSVSVIAKDDIRVAAVKTQIFSGRRIVTSIPMVLKSGKYQGTKVITTTAKSLTFRISVKDSSRFFNSLTKEIKIK
jgi:hypothetical protein